MTPKTKTIAIIGAGPVGSYTAYLLAKQGFSVSLFDSKKLSGIGSPIQCTGLLTSELSQFMPIHKNFLINTFSHIQIFSPHQHNIILNKTEYLVDRKKFDQFVFDLAIKKGVKFYPQHELIEIKQVEVGKHELVFRCHNKNQTYSPDIIVGAD